MVYAKNVLIQRIELWSELLSLGKNVQDAWLISGYFKNVLIEDGRIGQLFTELEIQGFKEIVKNLQFIPLRSIRCF